MEFQLRRVLIDAGEEEWLNPEGPVAGRGRRQAVRDDSRRDGTPGGAPATWRSTSKSKGLLEHQDGRHMRRLFNSDAESARLVNANATPLRSAKRGGSGRRMNRSGSYRDYGMQCGA